MSSNSLTLRFLAVLALLTTLNITFLGVNWTRKDTSHACSIDDVIDGVSRFIRSSGVYEINTVMSEPCKKTVSTGKSKEHLIASIKEIVSECRNRNVSKQINRTLRNPFITLFTTWSQTDDIEMKHVHNRTLHNWSMFRPMVELFVFTNSTEVAAVARAHGAGVMPIFEHNAGGVPVLRWMFQEVRKRAHIYSKLQGYVNSDILFTEQFVDTLGAIVRNNNLSQPYLVVGRRTNVLDVTFNESRSFSGIEAAAKQRGVLFGANAEDFFITNAAFPWGKILDVVVGRLAYDNWLVGHTICNLRIKTIDVTDTMLAVHQTTKSGGNFEGFKHEHAGYNRVLFRKHGLDPTWENGFTICAQELTFVNLCGEIQVVERDDFWNQCKCKYSDHRNHRTKL
ncbi:uncharacterized protein LOC128209603 [Mya arenaria]|nr:uncharacterized protein LOC128209603 [Mya arenaria]XP_052769660.1 uncharacterized protein LOC128209603 [Mya arenaria]